MRSSRYNIGTDAGDGTHLLFNAVTTALVAIDPETRPVVERLLERPDSAVSPRERELCGDLTEGGFLVPEVESEIDSLAAGHTRHRAGTGELSLTLAPTLACNFDCTYCFQAHETGRMTPEMEAAVLAYLEDPVRKASGMTVTWFGGEPTLCLPTVERLQAAFARMGAAHGTRIHPASIVTNGYRLDGETASRLREAGVAAAQVTLDGPESCHDRRRRLRGGQGTFRTILRNLQDSSEILAIALRVNVDQENADAVPRLLEELKEAGLLPRVHVYFAPVKGSSGVCGAVLGSCFTTEDFAALEARLYRDAVDRGFLEIDYPEPSPGGFCGADTDDSLVIGPNGLLFKCWEELSLDGAGSVGSVLPGDPEPYQVANRRRYASWDPLARPECRDCRVLPLCMGGCPREAMASGAAGRGACTSWKHNLTEILRLRYVCEERKEVIP